MKCKNPVLPGFYPDPSICRVGEDYYLVNSTFAYFPGIPVFHSRDLAHWEQIGNVLDRESQLVLEGCGHSQGIYAPSIRYHKGRFYLVTTNVSGGGNFVVTAEKPEGPWSEPCYLGEEAQGIDPSLFFDEDGTCYYVGQRSRSGGSSYFGDCEIWLRKLNLDTMKLEGEESVLAYGYAKRAVWPEGPHLYRKDGYYYLLHAEGGTEQNHCEVAARSRNLRGPYEYAKSNPILTHRHLGREYPVTCVGHADLVEDGHGNWYLVTLASRPQEGHTLMGRETFLAKVSWEEDWPVVNPGIGHLEEQVEMEAREKTESRMEQGLQTGGLAVRSFPDGELPLYFLTLRGRDKKSISVSERKGVLRLHMKKETLREQAAVAYVAVRQQQKYFRAETVFELFSGSEGDCAGLAYVQSNEAQIRIECFREGERLKVRVISCSQGNEQILPDDKSDREKGSLALLRFCGGEKVSRRIRLRLEVQGLEASCCWKPDEEDSWQQVASGIDLRPLSTESAGGFVGCTIGMYASSNGQESCGYADFHSFSVEPVQDESDQDQAEREDRSW